MIARAEFICRDALPWLSANRDVGTIVTSLPDSDEMGMALDEWTQWFVNAVTACMNSASDKSCSIFYQTDRKIDGRLVSKSHLCFKAAELAGVHCLWHKIALRQAVGSISLYRPSFTHMIAFSRMASSGTARHDVIEAGHFAYPNAAGHAAARFCVEFAALSSNRLVDPFCGRGTFVHAAAAAGMSALGIDIDPAQIRDAELGRSML